MNNKLTTKDFWIKSASDIKFSEFKDHGIITFIKKYIPKTITGNCIEIGSYPGPFLAAIGNLGYTLNGIDFHPNNSVGLPKWLQSRGYKTGFFQTVDFFEFETDKKFDLVVSFGFIEHFINFQEVIKKHADLVNKEGYLLITTPNFRGGIQSFLHKIFDKRNLALHNTKSMNPAIWKSLLEAQGFEIIYYGYFGDFWFWHGNEKLSPYKKKLLWLVERIIPRIRKIIWFQSSSFSAYAGIVAQKKSET